MTILRFLPSMLITTALVAMFSVSAAAQSQVKHVLLISVDGLHALDVANYVSKNPKSALAELARHGITYSNARTPANSDSFPGLLALVTGGSPISHGLFYDVSYDRTLFDPTNTTCSGGPVGRELAICLAVIGSPWTPAGLVHLLSIFQIVPADPPPGSLPPSVSRDQIPQHLPR